MSMFNEIRSVAPWTKDLSDEELIAKGAELTGMSLRDAAREFGVKVDDKRNPLTAGVSSGTDDLQGLGYSAIGAISDVVGATSVRDWANRGAKNNEVQSQLNGRPDLDRIEDQSIDSALPYLGYQVAKQVPNLVGAAATAAVVPQVAIPAGLARFGAVVPRALGGGGLEAGASFGTQRAALQAGDNLAKAVTGGLAFNYGMGVGSTYQSADENPENSNPGVTALLAGAPHALAGTIPQAMLFGKVMNGGGVSGNLLTRAGKNFAIQGSAGATGELAQGEIEMGVGKPLSDEEKFSQRLNAGVAGGLVEGIFGAAGSIRGPRPLATTPGGKNQTDALTTAVGGGSTGNDALVANLTQEQMAQKNAEEAAAAAAQAQANQAGAVKQQQANQQAAGQIAAANAQQQDDANAKQGAALAAQFGFENHIDRKSGEPSGKYTLGQLVLSLEATANFVRGMQKATEGLAEGQKSIIGAVLRTASKNPRFDSGVKFSGPKQAVSRAVKFLTAEGLDTYTTLGEVVQHIDDTIAHIAKDNYIGDDTTTVGKRARDLDALHVELTGERAPAARDTMELQRTQKAAEEAAKAAAKVTATASKPQKGTGEAKPAANTAAALPASQAPSEVTNVPLDQYLAEQQAKETGATNEQQQQQTTPRVGEVSGTGGQNEVGASKVSESPQSSGLDAVGAGSELVGPPVKQADGAGKKRTRYVPPAKTADTSSAADEKKTPEVKKETEEKKETEVKKEARPILRAKKPVAAKESDDTDTADDADDKGDAPLSKMEATDDELSSEDLGVNEDGESDLGFRTFDPSERGESGAGDTSSNNRSLSKFRTAVENDKVKSLDGYVLNNVFINKEATPEEREAVIAELERREKVAAEAAKKPKSKAAQQRADADGAETGEAEYLTDREAAERSWDKHASKMEGAPAFEELDPDLQETFIDFGPNNWKKADVVKMIDENDLQFSMDDEGNFSGESETVESATAAIKSFIGKLNNNVLVVVKSAEDMPEAIRNHPQFDKNARGMVVDGKRAYLIADNIPKGRARSIFLHEVGSHLGIQRMLSDAQFDKLVDSIVEWAGRQDGSIESRVAIKALGRVFTANPSNEQRNTELVAYFIEEAINMGVDPTAMNYKTEFGRWFRAVYAAMKAAIRKLGLNSDNLTAQDMVDMAYGAARLEIAGSWHGTAAKFRKFSHKYMNSGEGAQAFGWGTYVAEDGGIASFYRKKDVANKKTDLLSAYSGWAIAKDVVHPGTQQVVFKAGSIPDFVERRNIMRLHKQLGIDEISFTKDGKTETVSLNDEGSLFRTDANIAEDEYLDRDEPVSEQGDRVKKAVERIRQEIGEESFDGYLYALNTDMDDLTGAELYNILELASRNDEIPSTSEAVLEAQQLGQDDRAASMYLDELGIKGLKFLDSNSREAGKIAQKIARRQKVIARVSAETASYKKEQVGRRKLLKETAAKEKSASRDEDIVSIANAIDNYNDIIAMNDERVERAKKEIAKLEEEQKNAGSITRNSVIFNDKNIQRVATARGGDLDDMQFSTTGGSAQSKAQAAAQNRKIERNVSRLPAKVRPWATASAKLSNRVLNYFSFTGDIVARAEKLLPSASNYLKAMREGVAVRAAARDVVEKITRKYEALPKAEQTAVNQLLNTSTRQKKWAFKPSWMAGAEVDPALAEKYDALSTDAATVVREVFAHGYNTMAAMKRGVRATIDAEYAANIAVAQKLVDMRTKERDAKPGEKREKALEKAKKQLAKLQAAQTAAASEYSKLIDTNMNSPYAPLRRNGDHVVVMRSKEYSDAETILENAEDYTSQEVKEAKDFIKNNRSEGDHYQVHFFESPIDAEKKAAELGEKGTVQQFKKSRLAEEVFGSADMSGVIYRVRKQANDLDGVDTNVNKRALNNLLTQLHIQLLSEKSARHSELKRENIEGASENMMRSFYTHGLASASFLSGLHKSKEITDALDAMQRESRDRNATNRSERTDAYNEIAARHQIGMESRDTPITDKTLKYTSAYMLLSKPLYYVQNAVQPWAVSMPVLAGKFGLKAPGAMFDAYREVSGLLSTTRLTADTINKLPKDVQKLVQDLMTSGRLNFDLDQDMGDRLKGNNPVDGAIAKLQGVAERVETINRVTTAIAAYRLELKRGASHEAATNYAGKIVYDTHGDYSGFDAPRIMRSNVGRIATQFRKFQMIQISLLAKLTSQAFRKIEDGMSDAQKQEIRDERSAGRYALAYTLATTFTLGGTMALPGYTAIAWILGKAFGEDDEPDDPEAQEARMRKAIGDPFMADLLLKGAAKAFTGVDTAPIFGGWGNMLSILPYTKVEDMSRSTATNVLMSLAGPAVGQSVKLFEGVGKMAEGDMPGALQKVLPTGFANVVKAYELSENGVRRPNGAAILGPDEIGMLDVMGQALGLKSGTVGEKEFINRVTNTYEAYYRDEGQKVSAEYVKAYAKGDKATMEQARERWKELNDSRRENGFKVRPMSELFKAPQAARKNEQKVNRTLNSTGQRLTGYAQ